MRNKGRQGDGSRKLLPLFLSFDTKEISKSIALGIFKMRIQEILPAVAEMLFCLFSTLCLVTRHITLNGDTAEL